MKNSVISAIAGFIVGCCCTGVVALALGQTALKRQEKSVRAGWNLTAVVVAAEDLPAGTPLDMKNLGRHMIPEQFATDSVVRPEEIGDFEGKSAIVPLRQGDLLTRQLFSAPQGLQKTAAAAD